ncbi:chitobiase/beta-hexosaminidase C-terminal domain-containing protein [uncultured Oscillibacter sp.]|uniref:chitobiase/beta-hexosaminidase C-terminal domain-containing protein n=1 Tax=uncultured Oscillibacter sp. TaxID=876091 RepID=UPI0026076A13|nr:chitobiase/beta-hexosaminidase C-terminal domain-containing protein [uncultured Oscillibacter sp.]
MAVNYTIKYANKIAERFHKKSITDSACGHDYEFTGAKTIRVYSVDTVDEVQYDRNKGSNRFGDPGNLGDTTQEMTCTQQPAFTFVIEPLDNSDQAIEKSAGKALRRQLDERTVPGMDKYRLKKWAMESNIQHKLAKAPDKTTIVEAIIDVNALMTDALVPLEGRTLFIPTQYYKLLKQNPDFLNLESLGRKALSKGEVGEVDGCVVKPVPKGYLPKGVYFLIKYKGSTVDPVKLQQYDVLRKVQGYAGPVVQGVTYYDAFVLAAKGDGCAVCGGSDFILDSPTMSIASHTVTVTAAEGVVFRYTTDGSNPRYSSTAQVYTAPVELKEGEVFKCVGTKDACVGKEGVQAYE